ncbi:ATP cone domain-containing protein, partial [Escherichia coli]
MIKRDGCKVSFDQTRISDAIKRAAEACQITDDDYCE